MTGNPPCIGGPTPPQTPTRNASASRSTRACWLMRSVRSALPGLTTPWLSCFGNHDGLALGTAVPTPSYEEVLLGALKPTDLPAGADPLADIDAFTEAPQRLLLGPAREVEPDGGRRSVGRRDFVEAHLQTGAHPAGHGFSRWNLDSETAYGFYDLDGPVPVRVVLLDTTNMDGYYEGSIGAAQLRWLEARLTEVHSRHIGTAGRVVTTGAADRLVVLASHHGLVAMTNDRQSPKGLEQDHPRVTAAALEALLHRFGNVVLWLNGHRHRNDVQPRPDPSGHTGGFWEVSTASIADWPCQSRLVEMVGTSDKEISVLCTMLDSGVPADPDRAEGSERLAALHRELAANDPFFGVRHLGAGKPGDRNPRVAAPGPVPTRVSATGLVRSWAVRDGAVYAVLSTNFVTLGMVEFASSSSIPRGQLVTSVLISGLWVSFLVVAYAGLIVTVPRAGGDYIWQSRLLSGGLGFVVSTTGLWFILWLWAPIYGTILSEELFQPLAVDLGHLGTAQWFASSNGRFVASLATIALAGVVVAIGMAGYARVQLWCLGGGIAGFLLMVGLLIVFGHGRFEASVDHYGLQLFHLPNAYKTTLAAGRSSSPFGFTPLGASLRLVPMMMFYLLWPNTGSSLYGEVKGADEFRRVLTGMLSGLWVTVALSIVFLLLVDKTFGWSFYNDANAAWAHGKSTFGIFPYPALLAGWLVHNQAFQLGLVLVMSLWFLGWVGTLFLSSTRVIFAAAYDRVLPDAVARVSDKRHVPVVALRPHACAGHWGFGPLRLLGQVQHLHARRRPSGRRDVLFQLGGGGYPSMAQPRALAPFACQPGDGPRSADRAGCRSGHDGAPRLRPLRVALEQCLRGKCAYLPDLHGFAVRARLPRLCRRPLGPPTPGH